MSDQTSPCPDTPEIQFDPSEVRFATPQDAEAAQPRYNERLTMAVKHKTDTERTVQFTSRRRDTLRIVSFERIGETDSWTVFQNIEIPLARPDDDEPEAQTDALTLLTGGADSPPFHLVAFTGMSADTFALQYGHSFHPAA
jgi:hypothetical protein